MKTFPSSDLTKNIINSFNIGKSDDMAYVECFRKYIEKTFAGFFYQIAEREKIDIYVLMFNMKMDLIDVNIILKSLPFCNKTEILILLQEELFQYVKTFGYQAKWGSIFVKDNALLMKIDKNVSELIKTLIRNQKESLTVIHQEIIRINDYISQYSQLLETFEKETPSEVLTCHESDQESDIDSRLFITGKGYYRGGKTILTVE